MNEHERNDRPIHHHHYGWCCPPRRRGALLCGALLIVGGLAWLGGNFGFFDTALWLVLGPVLVVAWGLGILLSGLRDPQRRPPAIR